MSIKSKKPKRILSYPEAIREALQQQMQIDPAVILMGQGVDDPKAILGTTKGLWDEFGSRRVFDTPLSEDGMTGVAIGLALCGLRPVHTHIRMDFMLLAMNQIINMAAKLRYMHGGSFTVPIVIRAIIGKSWGQGPQHSQSLYPLFMNIPGLKIVAPSTPYDAKGYLISSIRDDNPVIFIEHRLLYYQKGYVPKRPYALGFGKARIITNGRDITLLGISHMSIECLRAQTYLKEIGIEAEVIDLVSLAPLDIKTVENSILKTKRLIVVDNAWMNCGAGSEIIATIAQRHTNKNFIFKRMGFAFVPCPTTPTLEKYFYPNAQKIASEAYKILHRGKKDWYPRRHLKIDEVEFRGPF